MRVAMPIVPSLPTKQPAQVVARAVGLEAAEHGDRAVGEHDLDREHVGGGDAARPGSAARRRWWRRCRRSCTPAATTGRARSAGRGGATARLRSRLSTPGSTHAHPLLGVDLEDAVQLGGDDDDAGRRSAWRRPRGRCRSPAPRTAGRGARRRAPRPRPRAGRAGSTPRRPRPVADAGVACVERELERLGARATGAERALAGRRRAAVGRRSR